MANFVELWVYLAATPLFGLTATLSVYVLALAFYTRVDQAPWANPVLWAVVVISGGLLVDPCRLVIRMVAPTPGLRPPQTPRASRRLVNEICG